MNFRSGSVLEQHGALTADALFLEGQVEVCSELLRENSLDRWGVWPNSVALCDLADRGGSQTDSFMFRRCGTR